MLFSQIIPLSPSPIKSKSLFFLSVSPLLLSTGSSVPSLQIPYICINILFLFLTYFTVYDRL